MSLWARFLAHPVEKKQVYWCFWGRCTQYCVYLVYEAGPDVGLFDAVCNIDLDVVDVGNLTSAPRHDVHVDHCIDEQQQESCTHSVRRTHIITRQYELFWKSTAKVIERAKFRPPVAPKPLNRLRWNLIVYITYPRVGLYTCKCIWRCENAGDLGEHTGLCFGFLVVYFILGIALSRHW